MYWRRDRHRGFLLSTYQDSVPSFLDLNLSGCCFPDDLVRGKGTHIDGERAIGG